MIANCVIVYTTIRGKWEKEGVIVRMRVYVHIYTYIHVLHYNVPIYTAQCNTVQYTISDMITYFEKDNRNLNISWKNQVKYHGIILIPLSSYQIKKNLFLSKK